MIVLFFCQHKRRSFYRWLFVIVFALTTLLWTFEAACPDSYIFVLISDFKRQESPPQKSGKMNVGGGRGGCVTIRIL